MSSISILEKDLTSGGGSSLDLDVVFVPGFVAPSSNTKAWSTPTDESTKDFPGAFVPTLCTTVSAFQSYFGKAPANIKDSDGKATIEDKSYIYAKNLLSAGLPVMYMCINELKSSELSVDKMLIELTKIYTTDSSANLFDKGEYSFKYLTSGGYPSFQVELPSYTSYKSIDGIIKDAYWSNIDECLGISDFYKHPEYIYRLTYEGNDVWETSVKNKNDESEVDINSSLTPKKDEIGNDEYNLFTFPENTEHKIGSYVEFEVEVFPGENDDTYIVGPTVLKYMEIVETTSGNPKSTTIAGDMRKLASTRGDCVALIDHPDEPDASLTGTGSYFEDFNTWANDDKESTYCAAFTPWVNINYPTYDNTGMIVSDHISMPPSFAYLSALANSIKTNASWLAVAGAARGQIPGLYSKKPLNINTTLTNAIAEGVYQNRDSVSINAITNIKPFGNRIWGNRTLKYNSATGEANLTATSFLNIRNMISDVKKVVYSACKRYTFEQNNDVLWVNFKAAVEPTLNKMKTGAGLSGYKIIQGTTTEKAKLVATIKLYPLYAVEDFEITVEMLDDEVKVS